MGNIGFLDGLLIHIRKPDDVPYAGMFWCERKHCFAINCQGICDGDLKLRYFSARCTGSTHDSKAFEYTQLGRRVMLGHDPGGIPAPYHLGGDSAYTSSDAMSVPWGHPQLVHHATTSTLSIRNSAAPLSVHSGR